MVAMWLGSPELGLAIGARRHLKALGKDYLGVLSNGSSSRESSGERHFCGDRGWDPGAGRERGMGAK